MSERQGSTGSITKKGFLHVQGAKLLLLSVVFFLCFILSGCGNTAESHEGLKLVGISEGDLSGMDRVLLYETNEEGYEHDAKIIEERVAAYSGGHYAFSRDKLCAVDEEGTPTGEEVPAVEFYIPHDCFGGKLPLDDVRTLISRPVELWIGNNTGTGDDYVFNETVAVRREDIVSAEAMEGCPPGITPFDYGIDTHSFIYLQVTLTDSFTANNPQILDWDSPYIIHDKERFEGYYHMPIIPSDDGKSFYILIIPDAEGNYSDSCRTMCETLAYDYTHEPLTKGYYVMGIPSVIWETPDPETASYQIGADDFDKISYVFTYKMEETICTDEDWETAKQAVRDRVEAFGLHFALGEADVDGRALVIRVEYRPALESLMDDLIMSNPRVSLCALGEKIRVKSGEAKASVMKQNDRYSLEINMSDVKKDTINKLTNLSADPQGDRIYLNIGDWLTDFPLAMTDFNKVIRDGQITLDQSAFTGETGFAEKDRAYLDLAACIINGSILPAEDNGDQRITMESNSIADLDPEGKICYILSDPDLDYSAYYDKLKEKAAQFSPQNTGRLAGSGGPGPTTFVLQFSMPPDEERSERMAESAADMIRAFKDDIFMIGVGFDWIGKDDGKIRIACGNYSDSPGKISINIYGYQGASQEDLDAVAEALKDQNSLKGKIEIDYVGPVD